MIQAIGNASIPIRERMERPTAGGGLNLSIMGTGGGYTRGTPTVPTIEPPQSLNEALDVVRYVASRRSGTTVIIIDEMERIETASDQTNSRSLSKTSLS